VNVQIPHANKSISAWRRLPLDEGQARRRQQAALIQIKRHCAEIGALIQDNPGSRLTG
jgi:hypothetical protein